MAVAKAAAAQKEKTRSSTKAVAEYSAKPPKQPRKIGLKSVTFDTWKKTCQGWAAIADEKTRKKKMVEFIVAQSDYSADDSLLTQTFTRLYLVRFGFFFPVCPMQLSLKNTLHLCSLQITFNWGMG
jgi:hypothetical protein